MITTLEMLRREGTKIETRELAKMFAKENEVRISFDDIHGVLRSALARGEVTHHPDKFDWRKDKWKAT